MTNRIYLNLIDFLLLSLPISPKMRVGYFEWGASLPSLRSVRLGPLARTSTLECKNTIALILFKKQQISIRFRKPRNLEQSISPLTVYQPRNGFAFFIAACTIRSNEKKRNRLL